LAVPSSADAVDALSQNFKTARDESAAHRHFFASRAKYQDVAGFSPIDDGIGPVTGIAIAYPSYWRSLAFGEIFIWILRLPSKSGGAWRCATRRMRKKNTTIVGLPSSPTAARLRNASARFRHGWNEAAGAAA
jgi:hypothetical protein